MSFNGVSAVELLPETTTLSESDRHRLLADERRRIAVGVVASLDQPVSPRDLAERVARCEAGGTEPRPESVERVHLALYHLHLPIMADLGVVHYDRSGGLVATVE